MKQSLYSKGFKPGAEKKSLEIRQQLDVGINQYCPARRVAELFGITVTPAQRLSGLVLNELLDLYPNPDSVVDKIDSYLSSGDFNALVVVINSYRMILFNADDQPARQESSIMHELAHILCEHPGDCLQLNGEIAIRVHDPRYEKEAEWLGAALQIPEAGLWRFAKDGFSNEQIASIYGASTQMVAFRRNKLGIDIKLSNYRNRYQR